MIILTHSPHSYNGIRGFTLVEAMVGLVILALGLLSLARFQTSLIESSGLTKARTAAINYGQNKMEGLRNMIDVGEFIDTSSNPYTTGSLIATGNNPATDIINESFTRSWSINNIPVDATTDFQADIRVTVQWTDATNTNQQVVLASKIAWMDPGLGFINTNTSSAQPIIPFPNGNGTIGDEETTKDTSGLPTTVNGDDDNDGVGDNTWTVTDSNGMYYLIDASNIILFQSKKAFATIKGIVALDMTANPAIHSSPADLALMNIVTSNAAGHCVFPLVVSPDPNRNGLPETDNTVTMARYTCYVAEGWYGNVGIFGYDSDDDICPAKSRSYRGLTYSADGSTIIGIFGLTAATSQSGDDFVVSRLSGLDTCSTIPLPTGITDTNNDGSPGPLKGAEIIIATQIGTITIRGTVTIDTTSTPAATSIYSGLTITPVSSNTANGACTGVANTDGSFSCTLDHGWAGTITLTGNEGTDNVCISGSVNNVYTHVAELSNTANEDFAIVKNTVACP